MLEGGAGWASASVTDTQALPWDTQPWVRGFLQLFVWDLGKNSRVAKNNQRVEWSMKVRAEKFPARSTPEAGIMFHTESGLVIGRDSESPQPGLQACQKS